MQYRIAFAALAAATPLVNAFGVTVTNKCSAPAYLWSVGDTPGQMQTLDASNPTWSQDFFSKSGGGGPSIKIKPDNNLWDGLSESQLEYKWDGSVLWYDLSYINGISFEGQDITMQTSNPSCPTVACSASAPTCNGGAYLKPDDNLATLSCPGGADLELVFCSGGSGGSPAPPVAPPAKSSTPTVPTPSLAAQVKPSTTSAPAGANFLENNNDVVMVTVTAVELHAVTITETSTPTPIAPQVNSDGSVHEKREAHIHQHQARGHSRVFGRHQH